MYLSFVAYCSSGQSFRKFIDEEFPNIANYVNNVPSDGTYDEPIQLNENQKDINTIWEDINANRNAITTIQSFITKILEDSKHKAAPIDESIEINKQLLDRLNNIDTENVKLANHFDTKLTVFMQSWEKQMDEKLKVISRKFDDKIINIKMLIGNHKLTCQKQINEIHERINKELLEPIVNCIQANDRTQMITDFQETKSMIEEIKSYHEYVTNIKISPIPDENEQS